MIFKKNIVKVQIEDEDLHRILERAEFDVEEMMDSPSLIEDDGSQEQTGVVQAPTLNAFSTEGLATRERSVGVLRGGGAWQFETLPLAIFHLAIYQTPPPSLSVKVHILCALQ